MAMETLSLSFSLSFLSCRLFIITACTRCPKLAVALPSYNEVTRSKGQMSWYLHNHYAYNYYRYSCTHGKCAMRVTMLTSCKGLNIGRLSLKTYVNRFSLFELCNLWIIEKEGTNNLFTPHLCTLLCSKRVEMRIYYYISTDFVIFGQVTKVHFPLITWAKVLVRTLALPNLI